MLQALIEKLILSASHRITKRDIEHMKSVKAPDNILEHLDIAYTNHKGKELLMDVYEPADAEGLDLPLIIYIHGGGLVFGDKVIVRGICHELAQRGFIVFSLNYQLLPAVSVYDQFDDISAGMDVVGKKILEYNVNPFRIYLAAESAGAYLAIYTAALSTSKLMQDAIGHAPTKMRFKAIALIGGMFYTTNKDMVGRFLSRLMYKDAEKNKAMEPYLDPTHQEVSGHLPPCLLVTSEHDFLRKYTEKLIESLWKHNVDYHYVYMGDDKRFKHAFPVFHPQDPASQKVIDVIKQWFNKY